MTNIDTLLNIAVGEIGVKDVNGAVKYSDEYGLPRQPWCVMFQWWCFKEAGLQSIFYGGNKVASCKAYYNFAKQHNQLVTEPQRGDLVIFSFRNLKDGTRETSHMSIIESVQNTTITTIDGNTNTTGNEANGGEVMRRTRNKKYVYAYIRPPYKNDVNFFQYKVVAGDTLIKIATRFYGDGRMYNKIMSDNQLTSTVIRVNQILNIQEV